MLFRCDAMVHSCSLAYAWRASLLVQSYPTCYQYYAPMGLKTLLVISEFKWNADEGDYADLHCETPCKPMKRCDIY